MTNDIGVQSLLSAAPVGPKKQLEPIRASAVEKTKPDAAPGDAKAASLAAEQQPAQKEQLEQTVEDLNGLVQDLQRQLRFSLDDDSGEMVVTVVDRSTDDVIRQIPAEDVLQLRERLEQATGAIFKGRA